MSSQQIQYAKKGIFTALAVFLAGYLFVILLTYTSNDPSWSHISSDMDGVSNMGGIAGAWIADLLYMLFGWFAWFWLVLLAYEAIQIWWQRPQPLWILRLIAYVFLIFSGSALCTEIGDFIYQGTEALTVDTNSMTANLKSGGIVGYEVASRLAHLLSSLGAFIFLLLFFIVAVTYAFNIHWLALLRRLSSLSWLGSEVKRDTDLVQDSSSHDSTDLLTSDAERQLETTAREEDGLEEDALQEDKYGQLPLTFPEHTDQTSVFASTSEPVLTEDDEDSQTGQVSQDEDNKARGVLEEFLVSSGLRETILQFQNDEKAQKLAQEEKLQAQAQPTASTETGIRQETVTQSTDKIEPSFAWNDHQVIDDLLATAPVAAVLPTDVLSEDNNGNNNDNGNGNGMDTMDEREERTHIEIVPAPRHRVQLEENLSDHTETEHHALTEDHDEIHANENENISIDEGMNEHEEANDGSTEPLDLTPTNTPPANPAQAPVVKYAASAENEPKTKRPTIQFAVPEGDESNHITEMMPTDDASEHGQPQGSSLPAIEDDAAHFGRSRAMQTAKYREQLTPIPEISILDKPDPNSKPSYTTTELEQLSELLEIKLQEFNVKAQVVNAIPGPVVTRFEVELAAGVKASKVTGISRDLARSLSMASLRVVEVIPGKPYIGIEVPNKKRAMVRLIELLDTEKYKDPKAQISMAMGKDIGGKPIITDLARAPHMLVAGTTGSGKSVLVNAMLLSILLKYKPDELRLILIDPKQLELANYNDIPHLLTPVVTDMNEAASSLSWCVAEMERRYQLMSLLKVRKLGEFNKKVIAAQKAGRPMIDPLWRPNDSVSIDQAPKLKTLPMIVIVADEFADMIMQVGKQAEE